MNPGQTPETFVEFELRRIIRRDRVGLHTIHLVEKGGRREFPISIGPFEAEEMNRAVTGVTTERPLTHSLLLSVIEALGARLVRVEVHALVHNTFHARLVLSPGPDLPEVHVDSRSSDAIALALRAGCPILVAESVVEEVRTDDASDDLDAQAGA